MTSNVEKQKFTVTQKIFRETNLHYDLLMKMLISRNVLENILTWITLCKKAKSLCEWCPSLGLGGFLNIHMD